MQRLLDNPSYAPWMQSMLHYCCYTDWFAVRLTCRAARTATTLSQTHCVWQRPCEWIPRLLNWRGLPGARMCNLLQREQHFLAGSFLLWALSWPGHWQPKDVDLFARTSWLVEGEDCVSSGEVGHYTPFLHDAFQFERPFYSDRECATLRHNGDAKALQSGLGEKLCCVQQRDGYELFPVFARSYMPWQVQGKRNATNDMAQFDYVMVKSGLGPETYGWFRDLHGPLLRLVLEYTGQEEGYTSIPAFFEATTDMAFCGLLFDGQRVRVQDWNAIWTRTAVVNVDRLARQVIDRDTERIRKLWIRTLHRVSKYRDRGFTVDIVGDTTALITRWNPEMFRYHPFIPRRFSFASSRVTLVGDSEAECDKDGLLAPDLNWSRRRKEPWRPTAKLQRLAALAVAEHKAAEPEPNHDNEINWHVFRYHPGPTSITSAPSTPRGRHEKDTDRFAVRDEDLRRRRGRGRHLKNYDEEEEYDDDDVD